MTCAAAAIEQAQAALGRRADDLAYAAILIRRRCLDPTPLLTENRSQSSEPKASAMESGPAISHNTGREHAHQ